MLEDAEDVVLVDVRAAAPAPGRAAMAVQASGEGAVPANAASAPLDLAAELPAYRIIPQPTGAGEQRGALGAAAPAPDAVQPLYILIDSGDGKADKKAAELRASGCARVAVLAGGETVIRRKGEPGLVRRGPGTGLSPSGATETKKLATVSEEVTP
jgi:hypothetical protein